MALIKTNARSASALDATILTGNLPSISGASLTGITSGGLVHIATTELSSDAAKIEFSNVFSTTYKSYLFVFNQLISTATSGNFIARMFSDTATTSYTSSNYEISCPTGYARSGTSGTSGSGVWGTGYFGLMNETFHSNTPGSGHLYVHNPRDSSERMTIEGLIGMHDGSNHRAGMFFGMVATTAQWYGMEFKTTSPNLGSGTSISLYGLANS